MDTIRHHSDEDLVSEARRLVADDSERTALLILYLEEIEDRRLYLLAGFGSMFHFCVSALGLSENAAFRRIVAARLSRRFPVIHSLLATGSLHLSTLELLRNDLSDENHAELLEAVAGKPKREVEAMLARRFPRPNSPCKVRPLAEGTFRVEFTASEELRSSSAATS